MAAGGVGAWRGAAAVWNLGAGSVGGASSCSCWAGRGATGGEGGGSWCRAALGKKFGLRRKWAKMLELERDAVCVCVVWTEVREKW